MGAASKADSEVSRSLLDVYRRLFDCYGPQHWWPAEEPFEVIVGAILTQSTAWSNVEKAIARLKAENVLSPSALRRLPVSELAGLIYPSGYYNAKALKLSSFAVWLGERYGDDLDRLFSLPLWQLREELLSVHGIGEETADSIILYAARKPIFVIDAYTRRIVRRLGLHPGDDSYRSFQTLFMEHLPLDEGLFNEYHALFVRHGKEICRRDPHCLWCCLRSTCSYCSDTREW